MMNDQSTPLASLLVVDDTLENLRLLGNMLGEEGYEVRPVSSGRQALQAVEHDPPDLVLLDVNMPGMDGYEVCRQLRAKDALKDVPVIFLTAWTDRAYMVKAFDVGGADYVTKPFLFEEVLARVATHLALRRARAALAERSERVRRLEQLLRELGHDGHIPA
jgi:DNA-binding response OmpR family regulator